MGKKFAGEPPEVPELVEILKALDRHRRRIWDETYGKLQRREEMEEAHGAFRDAFRKGQKREAIEKLREFVRLSAQKLTDEENGELATKVSKSIEADQRAIKQKKKPPKITFADFGEPTHQAFKVLANLQKYRRSKDEDEAYWNHPLPWLCRRLEERIGIPRHDLEAAAFRLNTTVGLRPIEATHGPNGEEEPAWADWLWMAERLHRLDAAGTTERLWRGLSSFFGDAISDLDMPAGFVPNAGSRSPVVSSDQKSASSEGTQDCLELSGGKLRILKVLGQNGITTPGRRLIGRMIASRCSIKYNSDLRETLSTLRRDGYLVRDGHGYYLSQMGIAVYHDRKQS